MKLLHPEVSWKVPSLFANDYAGLLLARELSPLVGRPLFDVAYGAPASAWTGGRPCRINRQLSEAELRSYFEAYRSLGIRCAFTFTWPDVEGRLSDSYCNMLLSLIDEYGGQAIVADDRLALHIRKTHPKVGIVASNNKCVLAYWDGFAGHAGEAAYYHDLLETYDEVVIRTEAVLEEGIIDEIVDIASRCEVLVNQHCVQLCECAPEHIRMNTAASAKGSFEPVGCIWRERFGSPEEAGRKTTFVSEERRNLIAARGFTKWKLGGRAKGAKAFALKLLLAVSSREGWSEMLSCGGAIREELLPFLLEDTTDPDLLTRIPR